MSKLEPAIVGTDSVLVSLISASGGFLISVIAFVGVFSALVFFHELGHFWVARRFKVRVETFSIGFGKTLVAWRDRLGTEWRIALIPLGGYVKFFGDASVVSNAKQDMEGLSDDEKADNFHFKPLYQRALIVAAGPIANFLLASVIFTILFTIHGQPFSSTELAHIVPDSAAEEAGLRVNDRVLEIDGRKIERFEELHMFVATHAEIPIDITILRDGTEFTRTVTPRKRELENRFGKKYETGFLGVAPLGRDLVERGPIDAAWYAVKETEFWTSYIVRTLVELVEGVRSFSELGGPLRIGEISGEKARISFSELVFFAAILSINLGLINLLPMPMLDGGHLLYYGFEAVRGKPLGHKVQEFGYRIGFAAVLMLMVAVTWNDLVSLGVSQFISNLFT